MLSVRIAAFLDDFAQIWNLVGMEPAAGDSNFDKPGGAEGGSAPGSRLATVPQPPAAVRVTRARNGLPVTSLNIATTSFSATPASRIRQSMVSAG